MEGLIETGSQQRGSDSLLRLSLNRVCTVTKESAKSLIETQSQLAMMTGAYIPPYPPANAT